MEPLPSTQPSSMRSEVSRPDEANLHLLFAVLSIKESITEGKRANQWVYPDIEKLSRQIEES